MEFTIRFKSVPCAATARRDLILVYYSVRDPRHGWKLDTIERLMCRLGDHSCCYSLVLLSCYGNWYCRRRKILILIFCPLPSKLGG